MRIPAERYAELRPILGWLAAAFGVEIDQQVSSGTTEAQAVTYNERKVVWVDDPKEDGRRPVIPFERLVEQDYPYAQQRLVASRLVGAVTRAARSALQQGERSYLLDFVHIGPTPNDRGEHDVQGLYADRALELAYGGVVLESVPGVGWVSVALLRGFCADLVQPNEQPET